MKLRLLAALLLGLFFSISHAQAACNPAQSPVGSMGCQPALTPPLQGTDLFEVWRPSLFPNSLGTFTASQMATFFQSNALKATTGGIGGGALAAGACTSATVAVTSATTAMAVSTSPVTYPGDGNVWMGYVSAAGTVTVKVCSIAGGTPAATAYNVRVIQ
jgi:hypothetical protein